MYNTGFNGIRFAPTGTFGGRTIIENNEFVNVTTPVSSTIPLGATLRNNAGHNPRGGVSAPGVPASTTPLTNQTGYDCMVLVTGGTVTQLAIGGTNTGLTSGWFRVPSQQTITLTYSAAPTWQWFGD